MTRRHDARRLSHSSAAAVDRAARPLGEPAAGGRAQPLDLRSGRSGFAAGLLSRRRLALVGLPLLILLIGLAIGYAAVTYGSRAARPHGDGLKSIWLAASASRKDLGAQLAYAAALLRAGDLDSAARVYSYGATLSPEDSRPYAGLAAVAVRQRRLEYAIVNLNRVVRLTPNDGLAWRALAEVELAIREPRHAAFAYRRSVKLDPRDAVAWRDLGELDTRLRRAPLGYEELKRALSLAPGDLEATLDLAGNEQMQGMLPQALASYRRVLAGRPDNPAALAGECEVELDMGASGAQLQLLVATLSKLAQQAPAPHTLVVLARVNMAQHDYLGALGNLRRAIRLNRGEVEAYSCLSQCYAAMRNGPLARKAGLRYQALQAAEERPARE